MAQCIGAIDVTRARVPAGAFSIIFLFGVFALQYISMPTIYQQRSGAVGNVLGPGPKGPWVGTTLLHLQGGAIAGGGDQTGGPPLAPHWGRPRTILPLPKG